MRKLIYILALIFCSNILYSGDFKDIIAPSKFQINTLGVYSKNRIAASISGWMGVSDTNDIYRNCIVESKDGGKTWDTLKTYFHNQVDIFKGSNPVWNISYLDENTIIGMGDCGMILKTNDGGKTWDSLTFGDPKIGLTTIFNGLDGTYYAQAGKTMEIYFTKDKGKTWLIFKQPDNSNILYLDNYMFTKKYKIYFFEDWSRGNSGYDFYRSKVFRTSDDGKTWEKCDSVADCLNEGLFFNDTLGLAIGNKVIYTSEHENWDSANKKPVVYRTTDAGKTWTKIYEAPYFYGLTDRGVFYNKEKNILAISLVPSGVLKSTDYGETWTYTSHKRKIMNDSDYTYNQFTPQYFIDENTMLGFGRVKAWLYKETTGSVSGSETSISSGVYPNPVVSGSACTLNAEFNDGEYLCQLFDYMGRRVQSAPVNLQNGKAEFNLDYLTPGSYIIRLSGADKVLSYKITVER